MVQVTAGGWWRKSVIALVFAVLLGVSQTATTAPSAPGYVDQAVAQYNKGNCTKALELLKKAIALNPRYARAYSWMGLCYVRLNRTREALAAFKKVIALAPNSQDAKVAQQWIAKLQPPRVVSPGPTYLVNIPAATGVVERNRPARVQLFGQVFRKAIVERRGWRPSTDATEWRVVYNLQRRYVRFRVQAGVRDDEPPDFKATFEVRGDGNTLLETMPKGSGDVPESIDVDITGVLQLTLFVRAEYCKYGVLIVCPDVTVVWADPRVFPPGAVAPVTAPPAAQPAPPPPPPSPVRTVRTTPIPPPLRSPPPASLTGLAVLPFGDSSGSRRDAGSRLSGAVAEELFKLGRAETISHQRVLQTVGSRFDPLDLAAARQAGQRLGARLVVVGIVERFQTRTAVQELVVRIHYKEVFVTVSFQAIDVSSGERVLSDSTRIALRSTAATAGGLPGDEDMYREGTRRAAADIAQKVALVWARRTGQLSLQFTQTLLARNVTRDADFRLQPVGVTSTFPSSSLQIVVYVAGSGAKPNQRIEFIIYGPDRREYGRGSAELPADQQPDQNFAVHHVIRPPAGGGFAQGTWTVEIRVDGLSMKVLTFAVTEG